MKRMACVYSVLDQSKHPLYTLVQKALLMAHRNECLQPGCACLGQPNRQNTHKLIMRGLYESYLNSRQSSDQLNSQVLILYSEYLYHKCHLT